MASTRLTAFAILLVVCCGSFAVGQTMPIKNWVVLMLENRAFDHMLGYLKQTANPNIRGLTGQEGCPIDPTVKNSPFIKVNNNAHYVVGDPGHSVDASTEQIFGNKNYTYLDPPPMDGFIASEQKIIGKIPPGSAVLSCFSQTAVPAISTLATQFALFDAWHASVPGPTEVNRAYVASATSHGLGTNDIPTLLLGLPQPTIFQHLDAGKVSWNIYMGEVTANWFFTQMRRLEYVDRFHLLEEFEADAKAGKLPQYSWVEPNYFSIPDVPATDQHPSHSVAEGEKLIKRIYEALRASPQWNNSALLITYDEHGGFYDHWPTPLKNVPNPDGLDSTNPPFDFQRLGIRVPAILVSPWVNKGTVIHDPIAVNKPTPDSKYEHSSLLATLKKVFNLPSFLTKRDAWAATFEDVVQQRTSPRTDCPMKLPPIPTQMFAKDTSVEHKQLLTEWQKSLVAAALSLSGAQQTAQNIDSMTEAEAAELIRHHRVARFGKRLM